MQLQGITQKRSTLPPGFSSAAAQLRSVALSPPVVTPSAARPLLPPSKTGQNTDKSFVCRSSYYSSDPLYQQQQQQQQFGEDDVWSRVTLLRREMTVAASDDNFELAARLRDEAETLVQNLPANKQLLLGLQDKLQQNDSSPRERLLTVQQLGDLGEPGALAMLQKILAEESDDIADVAEASMWSIFMKAPTEEAQNLLSRGMAALARPVTWHDAASIFTNLIRIAPSFAEGYNKRATTMYLMQNYHAAIADCETTLALNPYHFGAAAGMGLCKAKEGSYQGAIEAFELAIRLNPRCAKDMRGNIQALKAVIQEKGQGNGGGGGGGEDVGGGI